MHEDFQVPVKLEMPVEVEKIRPMRAHEQISKSKGG